ncbi:MAG: hypothetical protein IJ038_00635 [Clostridia bacterium]|nr:hypothetical protein [Clostridia bacterium]
MIIAVLFNSDHPSLDSYYGLPIKQKIFKSKILQKSNRHLKIGSGDLTFLNHAKTAEELIYLYENTLLNSQSKRLDKRKVTDCMFNSTIFAWVIQNVTEEITEKLHDYLRDFPSYLGILEVDFSYKFHLVFFRNYIGEEYRVIGDSIWLLCPMTEIEEYGTGELDELKALGFSKANFEDSGARLTIFDDYDTEEHFKQVDAFIKQTSPYFENGKYDAFELSMILSDTNPKLFNTLGAAVRAAKYAQNEEDVAQLALSGRRYLEQLADVLFEPSDEKHNGRSVRKAEYKNRIWAYIETSVKESGDELEKIEAMGKETDRLIDLFNSAIHGERSKETILKGFADLAKLSLLLLSLQPIYSKDPYSAYRKKFEEFILSL